MIGSVLLIDRDSGRQARLAANLRATDFRIVAMVSDSTEALRLAATTGPSVAVVGVSSGTEVEMHLSDRLSKDHRVPVVIVASAFREPCRNVVTQAGVMGFLVEPVSPGTLQATLEVSIRRFREVSTIRQESALLRRAVEARKVIERAKGLLMEVGQVSEREAYARIRRKRMDTQRPMVEIARAIIVSAEMALKPN